MKFSSSRTFPARITRKGLHGLRRDRFDPTIHALCPLVNEMPHQNGNVLGPVAQSRNSEREYVQSVKQVAPELTVFDHLFQVPMSGCNHADIHLLSARAAQPFKFVFLQDAQQLGLQFERDVTYFVEKERSFIRERIGRLCA